MLDSIRLRETVCSVAGTDTSSRIDPDHSVELSDYKPMISPANYLLTVSLVNASVKHCEYYSYMSRHHIEVMQRVARSQPTMKRDKRGSEAPVARRERRRLETREKLYRTAMELFAKRGYFETTTEDITEAADVGRGTFFNYIPTKSYVLLALSEKQLGKVRAATGEAEQGEIPVHEVFRRFIHSIVEELAKSQPLARSLRTILSPSKMCPL